jgi:beta-mannosidase
MKKKYIIFIILITYVLSVKAQNSIFIPLNSMWNFQKPSESNKYPAQIPGNIFTDLFNNNIIEDPFYTCNSENLKWIENEDWIYENTFTVDEAFLKNNHIELIFEGLDTYAEVVLNGSSVLEADNMFRKWKIDIKGLIKPGENTLSVRFQSATNKGKELAEKLNYTLPEGERVFIRKAQYHFGWDWGPRMAGCGIWKRVYIRAWNDLNIENVQLIQNSVNKENARLTLKAGLDSDISDNIEIEIIDNESEKKCGNIVFPIEKGTNELNFKFTINGPIYWWTHDKGIPHLYDFSIIFRREGEKIHEVHKKIGLVTIELVNEPDSTGESFYFKLNDKPIYIKGANYIPQDVFPSQVSENTYRDLLEKAKWSNMNMLRVWGGGIYENDIFYELCDSLGILVWQDFMFACALYPGDEDFFNNVKQEVKEQVIRLREHPSVALWCGNNEIDEGWHNWGWQKQFKFSTEDSIKIYSDYKKLFHELIPEVLEKEDFSRSYWPSSPKHGWGRAESLTQGDSHYWGVWWGMEPFSLYKEKVPRFSSEYGFQGFPELVTLKRIAPDDSLYLGSRVLKCHQKHPRGYETIQEYMSREWPVPDNLEDYIYVSQLVQAYGIKTAIDAHRSSMPYNMGTIYWQFNDCWPVVSWSGLDYYHKPKALQYFIKKAFGSVVIVPEIFDNKLIVKLINETGKLLRYKMIISLYDENGDYIYSYSDDDEIIGDKKDLTFSKELNSKVENLVNNNKQFFAGIRIYPENMPVIASSISSSLPKDFKLKNPEIKFTVKESLEGKLITLRSKSFAKNVRITLKDDDLTKIEYSDNFFDMEPGTDYPVLIKTSVEPDSIRKKIRITSMFEVQQKLR